MKSTISKIGADFTKKVVLASSSDSRHQLLSRLLLEFSCFAPEIDETPRLGESPSALVRRLATEKATHAKQYYPDHFIISSDQVCICGGKIYGKPGSGERAKAQLLQFQGKEVVFLTSLYFLNSKSDNFSLDVVETTVLFRNLHVQVLERYIAVEKPYECAGSFKAEGAGIMLFEAIRSTDPTALLGLPLITLASRFMEHDFNLLAEFSD